MSKINLVVLGGNLTRDPELRYTPSGTAICEFTIANNKVWTTDGEKKEKVNFVNCICWGKRGETISKYFQKGKQIQIQGELDFQSWEDKEGQKKNCIKVNVQNFEFVGGKGDGGGETGKATSSETPSFPQDRNDVNEEEIPF